MTLSAIGTVSGSRPTARTRGSTWSFSEVSGETSRWTLSRVALVADVVLDSGRSFVLDVSQFSLGERKRFMTAFGERLWLRQKAVEDPQPIHVFLEEAQLFLPQQPMPDDRQMVGIWTEIVRLGGNKGIGLTLITQRPQSVTKEALTQVECLVVLQVSGVPEKKALKEWIVEKELDTDLLNELPFLKPGEAYVWSPQWLSHFGKHKVKTKRTFDAGATPKVGVTRVKAELKPLNLEKLKTQMAEVVTKLEANNPTALKKRVVELERQLAAAPKTVPEKTIETVKKVEVPIVLSKDLQKLIKGLELAAKQGGLLAETVQSFAAVVTSLTATVEKAKAPVPVPVPKQVPTLRQAQQAGNFGVKVPTTGRWTPTPRPPPPADRVVAGDGQKIGRGAREMLKGLATRHPTPLTRGQVATLAGISPRSSTFRNYMSLLKVNNFTSEDSQGMHITQSGLDFLGPDIPSVSVTTEELVSLWSSKLPGKVAEMLQLLVNAYPSTPTRQELADGVGISLTSSTFRNYLSKLRANELVETFDDKVAASSTLFP